MAHHGAERSVQLKPPDTAVQDLLEGGTLDESIGNASQEASKIFNEKHLAYIAGEMLQGLEYLHLNHIVHRDLKSQNVMFTTTGEVKVRALQRCVPPLSDPLSAD